MSNASICPQCNKPGAMVVDSRPALDMKVEAAADGAIYRRRKCLTCEHRWTTIEVSIEQWRAKSEADSRKTLGTLIECGDAIRSAAGLLDRTIYRMADTLGVPSPGEVQSPPHAGDRD